MEHALTRTAAENDPDFLARVARSWTDALDQDGAEPSEELSRQLQGAFIRKPRHGLHHLEIFATAEQFEHLLTVMNTATNPRTAHGRHPWPAPVRPPQSPPAPGPADVASRRRPDAGAIGRCRALDLRSRPQQLPRRPRRRLQGRPRHGALPAAGGLRPQVMVTIDYRDLLARLGRHRRHRHRRPTGRPGTPGAPGPCCSPGPSPPPPSGRSPATPTSSRSCSAARAGSWTSAGPPGSSRRTSAKPSPPGTRAAPSPAAPSPRPGARPTTSATGPAAAPPAPTTGPCSAPTTTT